jgi:hypothetical protein
MESSDEENFDEIPSDQSEKLRRFKKSLKYISTIREPYKIFADQKAYEAFFYLNQLLKNDCKFLKENFQWEVLFNYDLHKLIANIWFYLSMICDDLDLSKLSILIANKLKNPTFNERALAIFYYIMEITHSIALHQFDNETFKQFNKKLVDSNILGALLTFYKRVKFLRHKNSIELIIQITKTIKHLTKSDTYDKDMLADLKIDKTLNSFKTYRVDYYVIVDEICLNVNKRFYLKYLKHLKKLNYPEKILNDQQAYEGLFYLTEIIGDFHFLEENNCLRSFVKVELDQILVELWSHILVICNDLDFGQNDELYYTKIKENATFNERTISIFYYLLKLTSEITGSANVNAEYARMNETFAQENLLSTLVTIFDQETFLKNIYKNENYFSLIVGLSQILLNMSENLNIYLPNMWKEFRNILVYQKKWLKDYSHMIDEIINNLISKLFLNFIEIHSKSSDIHLMIDNQDVYYDLEFIKTHLVNEDTSTSITFSNHKMLASKDFESLLANMFLKFYEIRKKLTIGKQQNSDSLAIGLNERRIAIFKNTLKILNQLVTNSAELKAFFVEEKHTIKSLFLFIKDEQFLCHDYIQIIECIILTLSKFMQNIELSKNLWSYELGGYSAFVNVMKKFKTNPFVGKNCLIALVFLSNDEQKQTSDELNAYLLKLLKYLSKMSTKFSESNKDYKQIEYLNDANVLVNGESFFMNGYSLVQIMQMLIKFATINSNHKLTIFVEIEALKRIIYKSYDLELFFSLKLLAQLCFFKEIADQIYVDLYLTEFLKKLNSKTTDMNVKQLCQNILFLLRKESNLYNSVRKDELKSLIMFSFNSSCLGVSGQIKEDLEKQNEEKKESFIFRLNSEHDLNSKIDEMSRSHCLIAIINEKFTCDESCQLELKLAKQLNVKIVSVFIQEGCQDACASQYSWLNEVVDLKLSVDIIEHAYLLAIRNLFNILKDIVHLNKSQITYS